MPFCKTHEKKIFHVQGLFALLGNILSIGRHLIVFIDCYLMISAVIVVSNDATEIQNVGVYTVLPLTVA